MVFQLKLLAKHAGDQHSYTINSKNKATIEVLLRGKAFRVKKCAGGQVVPKIRDLGWSRFESVDEAWAAAKKRSGWDMPVS